MEERLQKYLARCGLGSRRTCETWIEGGRVRVNGTPARLGMSVGAQDRVEFDGQVVLPRPQLIYWMLHKPVGYVTTVSDPQGRATVMQLLPSHLGRVFPVGRLDRDSSGLLLFTNDGELTHRLLHPSQHVWKTYHVGLAGRPGPAELNRLREGLSLDDGPTQPCRARWCQDFLQVEIREGRKRQVRRMLASLGYPVQWLRRVAFGPIDLGSLPEGQARALTDAEVQALRG